METMIKTCASCGVVFGFEPQPTGEAPKVCGKKCPGKKAKSLKKRSVTLVNRHP